MSENKLIDLLWYLLGETPKSDHSIIWDYNRASCLPIVNSPVSSYLHEVNRFLFDGGLNFDIEHANTEDARQAFIDDLVSRNKLQSSLESIWTTGAITGELLCVLRRSNASYSFEWFDKTEFSYKQEDCDIESFQVSTIRLIDNKKFIYKLDITPEAYVEYPLVEERFSSNYDWAANREVIPHNYRELPAKLIKNTNSISSKRGKTEFNFAACRIAASIILGTFDALENTHFFGTPMLASPDPDDTLKRLKARVQVLQKESNEDGGSVDVLNYQAIKQEHLELIRKLEDNFNRHMGIRLGQEVKSSDVSSLTLRILNSATISKAESKWQSYVIDGIKPLFELALRMSAADGMLLMVNPNDVESFSVGVHRNKPYFAESPLEVSQQLTVAQQLVDLGVDRVEALKTTVWPQLSYGQIEEKLRVNLEDL